jgi:hypothetical protein
MWLLVALLAVLAILIATAVVQGKRRVRALGGLAQKEGWTFTPGDVEGMTTPFESGYGLFQPGHSRMASDILERTDGRRTVEVFGYRYVIGYSRRRSIFVQTVVHIQDSEMRLPWFSLRPADAVRQVFGTQGFGNVFIHHAAQFSDLNYIAGQDPEATARRFTPAVIGAFGSMQRVAADGGGEHLFLFRINKVEKVADLQAFVARATQIADAFVTGSGAPPPPLA